MNNQRGVILIYLVLLLFLVSGSLLTVTEQYARMQQQQTTLQVPFSALLEKSVLKTGKN